MSQIQHGFVEIVSANKEIIQNLANERSSGAFNNLSDEFLLKIFKDFNLELLDSHTAILVKLNNASINFDTEFVRDCFGAIGKSLGSYVSQNSSMDQSVLVYDRDSTNTMANGARYHQTHEGGTIHTDNVNIPEKWDYLMLSCLSPAIVGGESILVNGYEVYRHLKDHFPKVLKTLESNFIWEKRGFTDEVYEAPIISLDKDNNPEFRHLRPYMESAHLRSNRPLLQEQVFALDVLDSILNSSQFQTRLNLEFGDILITEDSRVLHGRTCFADDPEAVDIDKFIAGRGMLLKRTMERVWIKKK